MSDDQYNAKEAERRREDAIKRMLATPPKPHTDKKKPSPRKAKAKKR